MEILEAIHKRKSVRAFNTKQVTHADIEKIIGAGIAAPSKGNSQIWEFFVITGAKKKTMDNMLYDLLKTDFIPSMALSDPENEVECEALKRAERRSQSNKQELMEILSPLGISYENFMLEGTFTFFNAPVAILVFVDEVFAKDLPHILSVAAAVQNMLLAATGMGLATCWIGGVWRYTKNIRTLLGIPDNKILLSSVALGHPDRNSPIYAYKSTRDDISEFINWVK